MSNVLYLQMLFTFQFMTMKLIPVKRSAYIEINFFLDALQKSLLCRSHYKIGRVAVQPQIP